ncbi:MAG: hypothetical protein NTX88_06235 [Candidatus Atribacteria bacterium]|nr:hypothetical protein [Candidatus Atribacteria bacterium]
MSNLRVLKQDDNNVTPSQLALYGNNQTVSVYDLQGNYQGTEMFFHLEAGVNSLYTTSTGHAMIYWAPAQVYQDKFKNFFTRMRTSYKSSLR